MRRGKYDDSRALLADSLELLEGRRRDVDDPDVDQAYVRALMQLGWIARILERYDEMLVFFQRADATLNELAHDPRKLDVILSIDQSRRAIVWLLGRKGLEEPRRRLMESHVRMLEQLSEQRGAERAIGLLARMARLDLALDRSGSAEASRPRPRDFPCDMPLSEWFEWRVADWIAEDIQPYPPRASSTGEPEGRPDPDAHAHAVILAIESRCKSLGVYPALLPAAAGHVAGCAIGWAAEQRRAGRLDDARWTAASLFAFAKVLKRRDPSEVTFHVVLSEAFDQEAKNAWKVKDFPTIEAATRNALVEASTALHLDPRNTSARIESRGSPGQDCRSGLAATAAAMSSRLSGNWRHASRKRTTSCLACPCGTSPTRTSTSN